MSLGSSVRSLHRKILVNPVERIVNEGRLLDMVRDVRRVVDEQATAMQETAEALGRTVVRLSSEVEHLEAEVGRLRQSLHAHQPEH